MLLAIALIGVGIGLDRLGLPLTGSGAMIFLIGMLAFATGAFWRSWGLIEPSEGSSADCDPRRPVEGRQHPLPARAARPDARRIRPNHRPHWPGAQSGRARRCSARCGASTAPTSTRGHFSACCRPMASGCWWVPARTPVSSTSGTGWPSCSRWSRTTIRARWSPTRARPPGSAASSATSSPWARGRSRCSTPCASGRSSRARIHWRTDDATAARNSYLFGGVVAGIAGYGNCVGIPDVGGSSSSRPRQRQSPGQRHVPWVSRGTRRSRWRGPPVRATRCCWSGRPPAAMGSQGAAFASAALGEDRDARRPAVQVGNPFLEKLLMEACLELSRLRRGGRHAGSRCRWPDLRALRALGAWSLRRGGRPRPRSAPRGAHEPYDLLLCESQERMLVVVRAGREAEVAAVFTKYELPGRRDRSRDRRAGGAMPFRR